MSHHTPTQQTAREQGKNHRNESAKVQAQHGENNNLYAANSHITNVSAKTMARVMSQTSALPARVSPQCRSEQCGLMPKCDCGTTNAEMPPRSYWGPCPLASLSTPQKSAVHHHCISPNHGVSWKRRSSKLVCLLSENETARERPEWEQDHARKRQRSGPLSKCYVVLPI